MTTQAEVIDPIEFAVIRNALIAAARDMSTTFKRTVMLPLLYEFNDFGMSLFDQDLNMVADAPGIPIFVGSLDNCLERTLEDIGGASTLKPGDVIMNNHPYLTAGQPADAALMQPIFWDDEIIGYAALRAHMGDVGAKSPYPTDATELFQEGTIFPAVKVMDAGRRCEDIIKTLGANSRLPRETVGSVLAGIGALQACSTGVEATVAKYGLESYRATIRGIVAHGERAARAAIEKIPDGTYVVDDWLDGNGLNDERIYVRCAVTVSGSDVTVDMSGSAPQQHGPINCPWGYTLTTCRFALKRVLTPDVPASSGEYRPLTVIAPEGSIFNPVSPAPSFISAWSSTRISDMVVRALALAPGSTLPADNGGDLPALLAYLKDPETGSLSFFNDIGAIGHGAIAGADGMNALIHPIEAGCHNVPAEICENRMPVIRRKAELVCDSGGAGEFRGGLASVVEYEFTGEGEAIAITEKSRESICQGLQGGGSSPVRNGIVMYEGSDKELYLGKKSEMPIAVGDRARISAAGGAGYGDPRQRDPERVQDDVRNGYVSVEAARDVYGVVVTEAGVDAQATAELRGRARDPEVG